MEKSYILHETWPWGWAWQQLCLTKYVWLRFTPHSAIFREIWGLFSIKTFLVSWWALLLTEWKSLEISYFWSYVLAVVISTTIYVLCFYTDIYLMLMSFAEAGKIILWELYSMKGLFYVPILDILNVYYFIIDNTFSLRSSFSFAFL